MVTTRQLLTVREVANRLGLSERTIWRRVSSGELPAVRTGRGRAAVRIDPDELDQWLYGSGEAA